MKAAARPRDESAGQCAAAARANAWRVVVRGLHVSFEKEQELSAEHVNGCLLIEPVGTCGAGDVTRPVKRHAARLAAGTAQTSLQRTAAAC